MPAKPKSSRPRARVSPPPLPPRPTLPPPPSRTKRSNKPRFYDEFPTGRTNENASRWRMISRDVAELEPIGKAILAVVARALAEMPSVDAPPSLLEDYDAMGERQKHALAAISHSLVVTKPT